MIIGYETMEVLAREVNGRPPKMALQRRGFRPTPVCGPFGLAAAVCRVRGLSTEVTANALAIACNHAAGLRRTGGGDTSAIRIQSGTAVRLGLAAVELAVLGVRGDQEALEGAGGFLSAFGADERAVSTIAERIRRGAGGDWAVDATAVKLHCTPQILATALDCVLILQREHRLEPEDVRTVHITLPQAHLAVTMAQEPRPSSVTAASGNVGFCAAAVLCSGDFLWPATLTGCLDDPAVAELATRVVLSSSDELTSDFESGASAWPARAEIEHAGGTVSLRMDAPIGSDLDDPASVAAVREKAAALVDPSSSALDGGALAACVEAIAEAPDFWTALTALTAHEGTPAAGVR